jgi:outer membrane immunogenic protein
MRHFQCAALTAVAVFSFASMASAADLPVKTPGPVVAPVHSWTGFYGGVSGGWAGGTLGWTYQNPVPATIPPFSGNNDNWIFGGHLGFQYQWNQIVLGVEAGVNALGNNWASGVILPLPTASQVKVSSIDTVGGRLGWAWNNWLFYGDGGWARGSVQTQLSPSVGSPFDMTSQNQDGWYAGGGAEYMLIKGSAVDVIVGLEYQHIDLGSASTRSSLDGFQSSPPGINGRNIDAKEDIVRGRLSLKWNPF